MQFHDLPLVLEQRFERTADLAVSLYEANSHLSAEQIRRRPGSCTKVAVIQYMLLQEIGVTTHFMRSGDPYRPHIFLGYQDEHVQDTYVDPTWQQFMQEGRHSKDTPPTLLCSAAAVKERLAMFAMQQETMHIWGDAHEGPIDLPTVLSFSPQVATVFRQRGWPQASLNQPTNVTYY